MIKKRAFFLICILFFCCNTDKTVELNFLDEYVLEDSLSVKNTPIGGLSGVDYANGLYYFVVDDAKNPRFLKATIDIQNNKINSVNFKDAIFLNKNNTPFFNENSLDLESIFVDIEKEEITFTSEGSIKNGKKATIFTTDFKGNFQCDFQLPLNLSNLKTIKHNGVLEGSCKSIESNGFWAIMESPLTTDGDEPSFTKKASPVRLTYFDNQSKKATKQFAYQLEHITKPAKANINLNGVTAILEYKKNNFFVIERTYQSGYGSYGNSIRIFKATIDTETTNIFNIDSLKTVKYIPLKKELLVNFETLKHKLTDGIIDNIEGITLGPILNNGNQTLLLVSDDNFQVYGKQLNQFILLEICIN